MLHTRLGIESANEKITLAALYLGQQNQETELVERMIQACLTKPSLKINLLFDHSRALRGQQNSLTTLMPLLRSHPSQVIFRVLLV